MNEKLIKVTVEQAAGYFAVTNLGGPFSQRGRNMKIKSGEDMDDLYRSEYYNIPEHEEALPAEKKEFIKLFKSKKDKGAYIEMLQKEGFTI